MIGGIADRSTQLRQVVGVNALEHRRSVLAQALRIYLVDVAQALAGVAEAGAAVGIEAELINAARHLGAEFFQ
ncbi:hypothetical protein D3C76_1638970 [compost metagenome]